MYTLGPLIHNPQVVSELEERGIKAIDEPAQAHGATLVMRTHGVTPQVEQAAHDAGAKIVDATCPYVKKAHRAAERMAHDGYQVIIVGEKGHPEVEGTLGHAPEALVIASADELEHHTVQRRVGVVVQTTQTLPCLKAIVDKLLGMAEEVRIINTICDATTERQQGAADLADEADVIIVLGGKNSANTTHLAEICQKHGKPTYHIESPAELNVSWFQNVDLIGIVAGASTPHAQIEDLERAIEALCLQNG